VLECHCFFRMQLVWPEESLGFLTYYLVISVAPNGVMTNDIYLSLVTYGNNGIFLY
jgi:cytochrome c oxidase subunit 1